MEIICFKFLMQLTIQGSVIYGLNQSVFLLSIENGTHRTQKATASNSSKVDNNRRLWLSFFSKSDTQMYKTRLSAISPREKWQFLAFLHHLLFRLTEIANKLHEPRSECTNSLSKQTNVSIFALLIPTELLRPEAVNISVTNKY